MNNTTATVVALAEKHLGSGTMVSSARLCLDDARVLAKRGNDVSATRSALRSLAYSVGILHADYRTALELMTPPKSRAPERVYDDPRDPMFNTYEA